MNRLAMIGGVIASLALMTTACSTSENANSSNAQPTPVQQSPGINDVPKPRAPTETVTISATALMDEFKKDFGGAKAKYEGKNLQVTGKVIKIKAEDGFFALKTNVKDSEIWCEPETKSEDAVANVRMGKDVTITGPYTNVIGAPGLFMMVKLYPCKVQ